MARLTVAGSVQHVHATREIKQGQQLCVHYTELFEPRLVRQQALMQEKFFSCACERCSVPLQQSSDRFLEVRLTLHDTTQPQHVTWLVHVMEPVQAQHMCCA